MGRLRKSIDAANGETTYAYSADLLTSITDPNGNVTRPCP
jgi:YD repeat-containing protein